MRSAGKRAGIAAIVLCVLAVAGGGGKAANTATSLKHVRLGIGPFLNNSGTFLAKQKGYFAKQGLDVELLSFRSSSDAYPLLASGRLDAMSGGMSASLINAIAKGTAIRAVEDEGQVATNPPCNR